MNFKVFAIGNILMKDDGIGIEAAKEIETNLLQKNIPVIYGETDSEYCITKINENDYIFILDSAYYGKNPGEITNLSLDSFVCIKKGCLQHDYSFLDLLKIYYPNIKGKIYAIEVSEVEFGIGLSEALKENLKVISKEILNSIYGTINIMRGD